MNEKNFEDFSIHEKVSFISHNAASIVETLFYSQDKTGIETFIANLELVLNHAYDCLECVDILNGSGNIFNKINLLIEYLGQSDMNENVLDGIEARVCAIREKISQDSETDMTEEDFNTLLAHAKEVSERDLAAQNLSH